jgi:hypothetical protein
MYTRQEASQIRKEFWTRFGQYMRPVQAADGEKRNWLNYKTGIRDIFFRMDADRESATVAIELRHADPNTRKEIFAKFAALKTLLEENTGEQWIWEPNHQDEVGRTVSKISHQIKGVNIFNSADWPAIISFLKPRIIALDAFWYIVKDGFE